MNSYFIVNGKTRLSAHGSCLQSLGGRNQDDHDLWPAWENDSQDPISKSTRAKWTRGMTQVVEHLLCKPEVLSSNSSPTKKNMKQTSF
jgi:hypothetical protein